MPVTEMLISHNSISDQYRTETIYNTFTQNQSEGITILYHYTVNLKIYQSRDIMLLTIFDDLISHCM